MNERIDQLWAQALDAAVPETYTRLSHSQVLKIKQVFAELIVQECVRKVRNRGGMCGALASNWIEEHFYGVEE